jgi:hypothetical protein
VGRLIDAAGKLVDEVAYKDTFPWPIAADAFGAGSQWFAATDPRAKPMDHQYMGVSLERVSFDASGQEIANWEPSAIDGATPGKERMGDATVRPIVEDHIVRAEGVMDNQIIRPMQKVVVSVKFTSRLASMVKSAKLEYFVDELGKTGEPRMTAPLAAMADGNFLATLDGFGQTTLVRYRILADRGVAADEVISPRPSDPYGWYGFFVEPAVTTKSKFYHLWVEPKDWGQIYANAGIAIPPAVDRDSNSRRVMGAGVIDRCMLRTVWDDRVSGTRSTRAGCSTCACASRAAGGTAPSGARFRQTGSPQGPRTPWVAGTRCARSAGTSRCRATGPSTAASSA